MVQHNFAQFCTISHNFAQGLSNYFSYICTSLKSFSQSFWWRPEINISGNMQLWFHNRWQKILISSGAGVISIAGGAEEKQQSQLHRIIQNFAASNIMIYDHIYILANANDISWMLVVKNQTKFAIFVKIELSAPFYYFVSFIFSYHQPHNRYFFSFLWWHSCAIFSVTRRCRSDRSQWVSKR